MKFTEKQLKESIRKQLQKKLDELVPMVEAADYTATKQSSLFAQQVAFDLEREVIKNLNLVGPDNLDDRIREKYDVIMEEMKSIIVSAVQNAIDRLRPFPRVGSGK